MTQPMTKWRREELRRRAGIIGADPWLAELLDEIDRLQAIMDLWTPHVVLTADNVPVSDGDQVYHPAPESNKPWIVSGYMAGNDEEGDPVEDCYSTADVAGAHTEA